MLARAVTDNGNAISIEQRLKAIGIDIANANRRLAGIDVHLDEMHSLIEQMDKDIGQLHDRIGKLGI